MTDTVERTELIVPGPATEPVRDCRRRGTGCTCSTVPPQSDLGSDGHPRRWNRSVGTASAVFNTFRQVGGAVAIAVFGALLANAATFVTGLQISLAIAAGLLLITAGASIRMSCKVLRTVSTTSRSTVPT